MGQILASKLTGKLNLETKIALVSLEAVLMRDGVCDMACFLPLVKMDRPACSAKLGSILDRKINSILECR